MKKIENRETSMLDGETQKGVTVAEVIKLIARGQVSGGYSLDDIRHRVAIIESSEKAAKSIELEEADYKYLTTLINSSAFKLPFFHSEILTVVDLINKAEESKRL